MLTLRDSLPILHKALETVRGQGMIEHRIEDFEGNRSHVRAHESCLNHVHRVAYRCDEHLRLKIVVVVDGDDILDQPHTVGRNVIETTHKGADIGRACLRCQQSCLST